MREGRLLEPFSCTAGSASRANLEPMSPSRSDSGLGFQVKALKNFLFVPFSLGSGGAILERGNVTTTGRLSFSLSLCLPPYIPPSLQTGRPVTRTWKQQASPGQVLASARAIFGTKVFRGVPPEQKMLKGHLPRVIYHQAY